MVFLSINLFQFERLLNTAAPRVGLKAKSIASHWFGLVGFEIKISLDDWWKLKEVAAEDELNASKGLVIASNLSCNVLDELENV